MAQIHYFQRFSQKENVITNNSLLLLSRIYSSSPAKLTAFLQDLLDPVQVSIGPAIIQQSRIKGGTVPDGTISQQSFKIIIETKQGSNFREDQIRGHLADFKDEKTKVLLLLGNAEADFGLINRVKPAAEKYGVVILPATFQGVLNAARGVAEFDDELTDIVDDFEGFLTSMSLLAHPEQSIRIVTCGKTIHYNVELRLYHEPEDRGIRKYGYLGLYANKAVRQIGRVKKIVYCSFRNDGTLVPSEGSTLPVGDEIERIEKAAKLAFEQQGWDHSKGHRYVLVDNLEPTEFKKSGPPLRGTRYFDLTSLLNISPLPDISIIADALKHKTW